MNYQVEKISSEDIDWIFAVAKSAGWELYLQTRQGMMGSGFTVDRDAGSFMLWLPRGREIRAAHYLFHCPAWTLHLWEEGSCEYSVEGIPAGLEADLEQARVLVEQAFKAGGRNLNGVTGNIFNVPAVTFVPSRGGKY